MNITLNEKQQQAHDMIMDFVQSHGELLTIGGYAGTGKTTLIGKTLETMRHDRAVSIAFVCFTGKAAMVLKSKVAQFMGPEDYCGTIHGLIYNLVGRSRTGRPMWERRDHLEQDIIILDEASMVDEVIFRDLQSYHVPIVAIGDHGQLPPVNGNFNLMERPDFKLEQIMRQAEDNPIIKVSMMARLDGKIPYGDWGKDGLVRKIKGYKFLKHAYPDIILCASNKTRCNINSWKRDQLGINELMPQGEGVMEGEPVICLKNNRDAGIFNGMIGNIKTIKARGPFYEASIDMGEFEWSGDIMAAQFGAEKTIQEVPVDVFDWSYCITVHKSQGSEWRSIVLLEERMRFLTDDQWRRWLYTGVTRAKEALTILSKE
jgi:exodeoxyribonuclease V